MKKRCITRGVLTGNLLKKLHVKKGKRTIQDVEKKVEKKVRSSLRSQVQALENEIREVEQELMALPHRVSQEWLWLGDIKRVG
jgi:hypothetical protein